MIHDHGEKLWIDRCPLIIIIIADDLLQASIKPQYGGVEARVNNYTAERGGQGKEERKHVSSIAYPQLWHEQKKSRTKADKKYRVSKQDWRLR